MLAVFIIGRSLSAVSIGERRGFFLTRSAHIFGTTSPATLRAAAVGTAALSVL